MDSENRKTLFQRAGEIIINKYLFFYANYIPPSVGVKRKFDESNV